MIRHAPHKARAASFWEDCQGQAEKTDQNGSADSVVPGEPRDLADDADIAVRAIPSACAGCGFREGCPTSFPAPQDRFFP